MRDAVRTIADATSNVTATATPSTPVVGLPFSAVGASAAGASGAAIGSSENVISPNVMP